MIAITTNNSIRVKPFPLGIRTPPARKNALHEFILLYRFSTTPRLPPILLVDYGDNITDFRPDRKSFRIQKEKPVLRNHILSPAPLSPCWLAIRLPPAWLMNSSFAPANLALAGAVETRRTFEDHFAMGCGARGSNPTCSTKDRGWIAGAECRSRLRLVISPGHAPRPGWLTLLTSPAAAAEQRRENRAARLGPWGGGPTLPTPDLSCSQGGWQRTR